MEEGAAGGGGREEEGVAAGGGGEDGAEGRSVHGGLGERGGFRLRGFVGEREDGLGGGEVLGWRGAGGAGGGRVMDGFTIDVHGRSFFFLHSLQAATEEACGLVLRPLQRCVRGFYSTLCDGGGGRGGEGRGPSRGFKIAMLSIGGDLLYRCL